MIKKILIMGIVVSSCISIQPCYSMWYCGCGEDTDQEKYVSTMPPSPIRKRNEQKPLMVPTTSKTEDSENNKLIVSVGPTTFSLSKRNLEISNVDGITSITCPNTFKVYVFQDSASAEGNPDAQALLLKQPIGDPADLKRKLSVVSKDMQKIGDKNGKACGSELMTGINSLTTPDNGSIAIRLDRDGKLKASRIYICSNQEEESENQSSMLIKVKKF